VLGEQVKILSELELDFDLERLASKFLRSISLSKGLKTLPEADTDDRVPEISEAAITVPGDLWQLGKHRVLFGNSLMTTVYDRLMDGARAVLVISDPPYNVVIDGHATGPGKVRHREFDMASGEMNSTEFTNFLRKAIIAAGPQRHRFSCLLLHGLAPHDRDFVCWTRGLYDQPPLRHPVNKMAVDAVLGETALRQNSR
jgi:hypothetical protein